MENEAAQTTAQTQVNYIVTPVDKKKTFFKPIYLLIIAVLIIAVLAVVSIIFLPKSNPIVAEVGKEKIYLSDYKERLYAATKLGTSENPQFINEEAQKKPLLDELVALKILDKYFTSQKVIISRADIIVAAKKYADTDYINGNEKIKAIFEDYVRLQLEQDKFTQTELGWKQGFSLICSYDRVHQSDYDLNTFIAKELLARQKAYAKTYCEELKVRLEAGSKLTDEIKALENDPVIGLTIWRPNIVKFDFSFDKDTFRKGIFPYSYDLFEKVAALENSVGKYTIINANDNTDKNNIFDAIYAVVYIESEHKGMAVTYEEWLASQKNELKVQTYIERIKL